MMMINYVQMSSSNTKLVGVTEAGLGPAGLLASTGYLLARVGNEARRGFVRKLGKRDLRLYHHAILLAVDELGPLSQQRLATFIGVDPRNLVSTIDFLERRGLVKRDPDPSDRRCHGIALTAEGRRTLRQLRVDVDELERGYLSPLTAGEQARLHDMLLRLLPGLLANGAIDTRTAARG
jgi:DNA-binding MarR family transcriptional regulator